MKIDGFGQYNPTQTIKANQNQSQATEFESVLKKAYEEGDKEKLKEACNEFESVMLQILYKQMKATVPESDFVEKTSARTMFEDMLDEKLMDRGSMRGMGISEMMYKQLSANMDKAYKIESVKEEPANNPIEPDGAEPVEE